MCTLPFICNALRQRKAVYVLTLFYKNRKCSLLDFAFDSNVDSFINTWNTDATVKKILLFDFVCFFILVISRKRLDGQTSVNPM